MKTSMRLLRHGYRVYLDPPRRRCAVLPMPSSHGEPTWALFCQLDRKQLGQVVCITGSEDEALALAARLEGRT